MRMAGAAEDERAVHLIVEQEEVRPPVPSAPVVLFDNRTGDRRQGLRLDHRPAGLSGELMQTSRASCRCGAI